MAQRGLLETTLNQYRIRNKGTARQDMTGDKLEIWKRQIETMHPLVPKGSEPPAEARDVKEVLFRFGLKTRNTLVIFGGFERTAPEEARFAVEALFATDIFVPGWRRLGFMLGETEIDLMKDAYSANDTFGPDKGVLAEQIINAFPKKDHEYREGLYSAMLKHSEIPEQLVKNAEMVYAELNRLAENWERNLLLIRRDATRFAKGLSQTLGLIEAMGHIADLPPSTGRSELWDEMKV